MNYLAQNLKGDDRLGRLIFILLLSVSGLIFLAVIFGMVRNAKNFAGKDFLLGQYVNDRPYVVSSFMSSAISKAFSSAMNGNCKEHPELVDMPLVLTAKISVLPAPRGGKDKSHF